MGMKSGMMQDGMKQGGMMDPAARAEQRLTQFKERTQAQCPAGTAVAGLRRKIQG
jgi:hypothetical protein